jgi:hypothetical protein
MRTKRERNMKKRQFPWRGGVYQFAVVEAEQKVSGGIAVVDLKLEIFKSNGGKLCLKDRLTTDLPRKLMHAAKACDVPNDDPSEVEDLLRPFKPLVARYYTGKSGKLMLGHHRKHSHKNLVLDYVC